MISKVFSAKMGKHFGNFYSKIFIFLCHKLTGFEESRQFFKENWSKLPKLLIITLIPELWTQIIHFL
jgi:hypothetical protein